MHTVFCKLLGEECTRSRSHAASVHNSGRQLQMNNSKSFTCRRFNSADFYLLRKSFTALLRLLGLYLFFFTKKKKETLVLMSDMRMQHIVIRFPVCHT